MKTKIKRENEERRLKMIRLIYDDQLSLINLMKRKNPKRLWRPNVHSLNAERYLSDVNYFRAVMMILSPFPSSFTGDPAEDREQSVRQRVSRERRER